MTQKKRKIRTILLRAAAMLLIAGAIAAHYLFAPWGFYRRLPRQEAALRTRIVSHSQRYLGFSEENGAHRQIIDLYNSHEPLAMGYQVQYTDSWCATYVSAVAIGQELTDIIPTECSCERQIGLWKALGRWQERDDYIPSPGDIIYYDWDAPKSGDCTGWSDHVGIVVGTKWPFIRVIEGNRDDMVTYRTILADDPFIRGYGLPDYGSLAN